MRASHLKRAAAQHQKVAIDASRDEKRVDDGARGTTSSLIGTRQQWYDGIMSKRKTMTKDEFSFERKSRMTSGGMREPIRDVDFVGGDWRNVNFSHTKVEACDWVEDEVDFAGSSFHMALFKDVEIKHGNFQGAALKSTSFDKCRVDRADFKWSQFRNTGFTRCDLYGSTLPNSKQVLVDYSGSDLRDAIFADAPLIAVDFRGADLRNASGLPDAAKLVDDVCKIGGATGIAREGVALKEYEVLHKADPSRIPEAYSAASCMDAIAQQLHNYRKEFPDCELQHAIVNGEEVRFFPIFHAPHLVVDQNDPTNQITRLLGVDDPMPLEVAEVYDQLRKSVVLRGIDIEKHRNGKEEAVELPTEWDKWEACNRPPGQLFVTPIFKTLSGPSVSSRAVSIVR